jgi:hypothetical protein
MPKGVRLDRKTKRAVARAFVDRQTLADISKGMHISLSALYHMRQADKTYQSYEQEFEGEAVTRIRLELKRSAAQVLRNLLRISELPHDNEVVVEHSVKEDANGNKVRTERRSYRTDPKILLVKYEASNRLLESYLRVVATEAQVEAADILLQQRDALLKSYGIEIPKPFRAGPQRPVNEDEIEPNPDASPAEIEALLADLRDVGGG